MKRLSGLVVLLLLAGCGSGDDSNFQFSDNSDGGTSKPGSDSGKAGAHPGQDGSVGGGGGDDDSGLGGGDDDDGGTVGPGDDSGGGGKDSGPVTTSGSLAAGLTITDIALFQGSKVPLVKAGAAAGTPKYVPVVAGRQGLIRVYVSGTSAKPVTAELTLTSSAGTKVLTDPNRTLTGASTDSSLTTTFNIDVPPDVLAKDTTFMVRLLDASGGGSASNTGAQYPTSGTPVTIGAQSDGPTITITLVPVRYNADGSGRLPDTSAAQVKIYSDFIAQTYPVAKLDFQVRAPVDYSAAIGATSSSQWGNVLDFVLQLRDSDNAADNNYYYGIFAPAAPDQSGGANNYCRSGCILGIAPLTSSPNDTSQRGGVGAGYTGLEFATTMAQEVGHSCGLNHAPYPAAGSANAPASPDPNYPYASAYIGQWGYGFLDKKLYDPAQYRDFMSYAESKIWVSDYVQGLFFKRFKAVNHASFAQLPAKQYQRIYLWQDGSAHFGAPSTFKNPPQGEAHAVDFRDASGQIIGSSEGQYFELDTKDGGYLLVPDAPSQYASVRVRGFGSPREITK